jgi:hypothetical protein
MLSCHCEQHRVRRRCGQKESPAEAGLKQWGNFRGCPHWGT